MNDADKARFQRALDVVEWLDLRIAQRLEQQLEQRLAREREYWRCHVVDLITAEREQLVELVELERNKIIELVKADHAEVSDLVERTLEQSTRQAMKGFRSARSQAGSGRGPHASPRR